jgi:hypothetical protein
MVWLVFPAGCRGVFGVYQARNCAAKIGLLRICVPQQFPDIQEIEFSEMN